MDSVKIYSGSRAESALLKGILEENGIPVLERSDHGEGFVLRAGGMFEKFYLYVRPEDAEKASQLAGEYAKHLSPGEREALPEAPAADEKESK